MASTSELSIVSRMAGSGLPRRTAVKVGTGAIATTLILAWLRMSKARRFDCQRSARSPSPLKRKNPENRYEDVARAPAGRPDPALRIAGGERPCPISWLDA